MTRFAVSAFVVALLLFVVPSLLVTASPPDQDAESKPIYHMDATLACGVEPWSGKTGIDRDARNMNTPNVVTTTVDTLDAKPYPTLIPSSDRIDFECLP